MTFEINEIYDIINNVIDQFDFKDPEKDAEKNLISMKLKETFEIRCKIKLREENNDNHNETSREDDSQNDPSKIITG